MTGTKAKKIRFAMIGCGRMGRQHSEKMIADGRGEAVALFDAEPSMAKRLQQELWPSAVIARNMAELISRDDIDAAIICTPTAEHYSQANLCLNRGWHVLCEKPLASDRGQILDLMKLDEVCRSRHQIFSLGYQRRFWSIVRTLRREVQSGRWGAVRAVSSHNVEDWQSTIGGTWRDDPKQNAGGFITDAGSHKIDVLFYVTGLSPVQVFARTRKSGSHVEILGSVSALLTNQVSVTMDFIGNAHYLGEDLHIHCERGDIMMRHEELWVGREGRRERLASDEPDSNPVSGLLDMILDNHSNLSPPEAALPVYDMTQAILTSSSTGLPVNL